MPPRVLGQNPAGAITNESTLSLDWIIWAVFFASSRLYKKKRCKIFYALSSRQKGGKLGVVFYGKHSNKLMHSDLNESSKYM